MLPLHDAEKLKQPVEAEAAAKPCSYVEHFEFLSGTRFCREETAGGIYCHHATGYDQMSRGSAETDLFPVKLHLHSVIRDLLRLI